jgi:phosphate acyltransferase
MNPARSTASPASGVAVVRLAVDCMGGDHGPAVTLPACRAFLAAHPQAELILVGKADALAQAAGWPRCSLVVATEVVEMDDAIEWRCVARRTPRCVSR